MARSNGTVRSARPARGPPSDAETRERCGRNAAGAHSHAAVAAPQMAALCAAAPRASPCGRPRRQQRMSRGVSAMGRVGGRAPRRAPLPIRAPTQFACVRLGLAAGGRGESSGHAGQRGARTACATLRGSCPKVSRGPWRLQFLVPFPPRPTTASATRDACPHGPAAGRSLLLGRRRPRHRSARPCQRGGGRQHPVAGPGALEEARLLRVRRRRSPPLAGLAAVSPPMAGTSPPPAPDPPKRPCVRPMRREMDCPPFKCKQVGAARQ